MQSEFDMASPRLLDHEERVDHKCILRSGQAALRHDWTMYGLLARVVEVAARGRRREPRRRSRGRAAAAAVTVRRGDAVARAAAAAAEEEEEEEAAWRRGRTSNGSLAGIVM